MKIRRRPPEFHGYAEEYAGISWNFLATPAHMEGLRRAEASGAI